MNDATGYACGNCAFFHPPEAKQSDGTCWRYPPTAFSIPVQAPRNSVAVPEGLQGAAIQGVMTLPVRPPVNAETPACGEWEDSAALD